MTAPPGPSSSNRAHHSPVGQGQSPSQIWVSPLFPILLPWTPYSLSPCADRDGTVDLIFPTCESFSTSTGIGRGCSINIAYNKQKPLCASTSPGAGGFGPERNCRSPDALCVADPDFNFNLQSSPEDDVCIQFFFLCAVEELQAY